MNPIRSQIEQDRQMALKFAIEENEKSEPTISLDSIQDPEILHEIEKVKAQGGVFFGGLWVFPKDQLMTMEEITQRVKNVGVDQKPNPAGSPLTLVGKIAIIEQQGYTRRAGKEDVYWKNKKKRVTA